ncbi:MAG: pseudouridine synthase [Gammaproteobacteria bacterium]|jgi:23S rRNA pseudouridine2605 synthase|uniref:Pseudouridine synthase n=1 Tax=SAR86 cluster bacterium TaxID=2030880 RepID=A0A838YVU2_9GAMM|nr:rRNA pseudouridine synthase [SAR86 cluster bacterium]|tara:strand:+ start:637 stop:1368 length:732 start_codon:yes stop_codon:yes gene_type:complete
MAERLQKFLAKSGIGSRRHCESLIKEGLVKVNGEVAKIGTSVSEKDEVEYDAKVIESSKEELKVIILNKPEGVLSSNAREKKIPITFDYLPKEGSQRNWISIGRLDINTSGLMLFTNNGNFANKCMHPSYQVDKEYLVRARGEFTQATKEKMLEGINIDGSRYKFTDIVEGEKTGSNQWFSVCLISGKNREVRKIFNYFDMEVSRLKRTRFGPIFLPSTLGKGQTKLLTEKEISELSQYGRKR